MRRTYISTKSLRHSSEVRQRCGFTSHVDISNEVSALNDIIFNPSPTPEQKNHRGTGVLEPVDIDKLKKNHKIYSSAS